MSSTNQWTVVKPKNKNPITKTNKTKATHVNGQAAKHLNAGIQESKTIFNALAGQDEEELNVKAPLNFLVNGNDKKKKKQNDKKKVEKKITTIDEALEAIFLKELKSNLETVQTKFPESPEIWLKDLMKNLNSKLAFDITDPLFLDKDTEYPCSSIDFEAMQFIEKTINSISTSHLTSFLEYCLVNMTQDMAKNLHTYGYRIFIQCVSKNNPTLILKIIPKLKELKTSYLNRHPIFLSLLWAVGYSGRRNLDVGLRVWHELMWPVITMKPFSKFCLDYLDSLLRINEGKSSTVLSVKDHIALLEHVSTFTGPSLQIQKQFLEIYPKLKKAGIGAKPEQHLRNFFPSYLTKLKHTAHPIVKNELYSSLMECLSKDTHCYSLWRQLYTKNLVQSSIILSYIKDHFVSLSKSFPTKHLKETLKTFQVTNDELKGGKKSSEGLEKCILHCDDLLGRMAGTQFPFKLIFFFLIVSCSLFVTYDININNGFDKSLTGQTLHDLGAVTASKQALAKLNVYYVKSLQFMEEKFPVYYKFVKTTSEPYIELAYASGSKFYVYVMNNTKVVRDYAAEKIPPIVEYVKETTPVLTKDLSKRAGEMVAIVRTNFNWTLKYYQEVFADVSDYLHENVLSQNFTVENIQKQAVSTLVSLQDMVLSLYNRLGTYLQR